MENIKSIGLKGADAAASAPFKFALSAYWSYNIRLAIVVWPKWLLGLERAKGLVVLAKYPLKPKLFIVNSLHWMIFLLFPSIILDNLLLYRLIAEAEVIQWGTLAMLLLMVFLLLQGPVLLGWWIYYRLRRAGFVEIQGGRVSYFKRKLVYAEFEYGYAHYVHFLVRRVDKVKWGHRGAIRVWGEIEAIYYKDDGRTEHHRKTGRYLTIPCYYDGLGLAYQLLQEQVHG